MKRLAIFPFLFLTLLSPVAFAAVQTSFIEYEHDGQVLMGFLAYDDAVEGKRPGVLIVHEWKGFGDYVQMRARQLAEEGYVAFAVDMYGKGIYAKDHQEAARLSGMFRQDRDLMRSRAAAGLKELQKVERVDTERVAAIGYCFGGTTVLELARAGKDLDAVVSFHGGLGTPVPAREGEIQSRVLVFHGAADPHTSAEDLQAFKQEMEQSGADWWMVTFGGAAHSFTVPSAGDDPSTGKAYDEKADKRSWRIMTDFFRNIFDE